MMCLPNSNDALYPLCRGEKSFMKPEYPLSEVTARIIAATRKVHRELGPGFEEVIALSALSVSVILTSESLR